MASNTKRNVKIIFKHLISEAELIKVKQEVKIQSSIDHPNILKIHEAYQDDKKLFIIQEHLDGIELFDYIVT